VLAVVALAGCQRAGEHRYREVSAQGVGPGGGLGFQQEGGEQEIPPLTWWEGCVTSIEAAPPSFDPAVGQGTEITVTLSQQAQLLLIRIVNSLDEQVKVLYAQSAQSGDTVVEWDGSDAQENQARYSIYLVDVCARDGQAQVIGSGQSEVILYRPKGGVSMQDADKYRNEDGEYIHSGDEWVAAGLVNPGDVVQVRFNGSPLNLADLTGEGVFRSQPFPEYSAGEHSVRITVYPLSVQASYNIDYTVYLNRIHFEDLVVFKDGEPVQHSYDYFVPADGEEVRLGFSLDAAEDALWLYAVQMHEDADPVVTRTTALGPHAGGEHYCFWDGKDDHGVLCIPGDYSLVVLAQPDVAAEVFSPAGIFITKRIELREGS